VPEIEAAEPKDDGQGSGPVSAAEHSKEENSGFFSAVAEIGGQNSPISMMQRWILCSSQMKLRIRMQILRMCPCIFKQ
jgi:hypothetical protein